MGNKQSNRLTEQQEQMQGVIGIFGEGAQQHDTDVFKNSCITKEKLEKKYPMFNFRHRKEINKKEINEALRKVDQYLGQTLFVNNSKIKPDGGVIEVEDDNGNWRVILVSEAKYQGKDIENIRKGILVGKKKDQDFMVAGNAIERAHKNISEMANFMLSESYFPYILFLEGSNFLTHNITVNRPDGSPMTITYNAGSLNRLDRLTAANYGMPINTNLCENRFVSYNKLNIMLQATSIYTQGDGARWKDDDMIEIMLEVAETSLKMLGKDLFNQLTNFNKI